MQEEDYVLIERYLGGDLPAAEARSVTARATTDPAFAAALEERRHLNAHLAAVAGEETLNITLKQLGSRYFTEPEATVRSLPRRTGSLRWLAGLAAAAVVALLVILFLPGPGGNPYEQFATHEPLALTERSDATADPTAAEAAYNRGDYAAAIPLLEAYLAQRSDDLRARLALGVSLLETDRDREAVAIFNEIAEGSSALAAYGNWYLALAAVKRGDDESALSFLDRIPATDAYLTNKAETLRAAL